MMRLTRIARIAAIGLSLAPVFHSAANVQAQSIQPGFENGFDSLDFVGATSASIAQMAFAPGDFNHLYVATYGQGVLRFDYDAFSPNATISNPVTVVPSSITNIGGVDGSLGIAFHQDPTLGTVMYLAPSIVFRGGAGTNTIRTQSIVRVTDANGDGTWGGAGDVNQAVVNNIEVTELHSINQLQVRNNTLFAGVGSRTQNGGITTPGQGNQAHPGELAYTGAINFIEDLTQLSGDTTTANVAGFTISSQKTDVQTMTSTDPGKMRVYSTGWRNVFGIRVDPNGQLWGSMNQNESPQLPDELAPTFFQADHGFEKRNDVVGDWRAGISAPSQAAINAGYFQDVVDPLATLGNNSAAGGFDFIENNSLYEGDAVVSRWTRGDVVLVDRQTGSTQVLATGFSGPLDVLRDPLGNLLVGENIGGGGIYRLNVVNDLDASRIVLSVNRDTGVASLRNNGTEPIELDGYSIYTALGSLSPGDWTSLEEQGALGGGWQQSPATSHRLAELKETGVGSLGAGQEVSLGAIFAPSPSAFGQPAEDLVLQYTSPLGSRSGVVNYSGTKVNTLLLHVDPMNGEALLRNTSDFTVEIDGYTIASASGLSLDPAGWSSLDDQNAAGGDWAESPSTTARLSELKEGSSTSLAPGESLGLGTLFDTTQEQDLTFQFLLFGASTPTFGKVLYTLSAGVPGDFDHNGTVNGQDLDVWKNNFGPGAGGDADGDGDTDGADFLVWQRNFGASSGQAPSHAVPEPQAWILVLMGAVAAAAGSRQAPGRR